MGSEMCIRDSFEGERWDESKIEEINSEIEAIKDKFPRPPKRRV